MLRDMINPAVLSALPELTAIQVSDFWGEYLPHPRSAWRDEVAAGDTQLGYWEWVEHRLEEVANAAAPAPVDQVPIDPAAEVTRLRAMNMKLHQVCQQLLSRFEADSLDQQNALHRAVESLLAEIDSMRVECRGTDWLGGFSEAGMDFESNTTAVEWPNLLICADRVRQLLSNR